MVKLSVRRKVTKSHRILNHLEAFLISSTNSANYDNLYCLYDFKILQIFFSILCYFIFNDIRSVKEKPNFAVDKVEATKLKYKEKHRVKNSILQTKCDVGFIMIKRYIVSKE